jgi:hypothetical protein
MPKNITVQAMLDLPKIEIQPPPNNNEAIPHSGIEDGGVDQGGEVKS